MNEKTLQPEVLYYESTYRLIDGMKYNYKSKELEVHRILHKRNDILWCDTIAVYAVPVSYEFVLPPEDFPINASAIETYCKHIGCTDTKRPERNKPFEL